MTKMGNDNSLAIVKWLNFVMEYSSTDEYTSAPTKPHPDFEATNP
jgi:hypothetical protein